LKLEVRSEKKRNVHHEGKVRSVKLEVKK